MMKLHVTRSELVRGLGMLAGVISSKAAMPVLSRVLLQAYADGRLIASGTNLDQSMRVTMLAKVSEAGQVTLPFHRTLAIIKDLPVEDVHIDVGPSSRAAVSSGSSRYLVLGCDASDVPAFPDVSTYSTIGHMSQAVFRDALSSVAFACSHDETRFVLNSVLLRFGGGAVKLAATDGQRLATCDAVAPGLNTTASCILPIRTANELMRRMDGRGDVKILHVQQRLTAFVFTSGDADEAREIVYASRLIEGQFPAYERILPDIHAFPFRSEVDREELHGAVHRASLVASEKSNTVSIETTNDALTLMSRSPDGDSNESFPGKFAPGIKVAFNCHFLLDALRGVAFNKVTVALKDEASAGIISANGWQCMIMPVRLN